MRAEAPAAGRRITVLGTVQGVGFRPWVCRLARSLGLAGSVENGPDGVTIDAYGGSEVLDELVRRMRAAPPPAARIDELAWRPLDGAPPVGFAIATSRREPGGRRACIPPDLATCAECEAEIRDPSSRRHRYAFTSCAHCGPRLTIATAVPYDRAFTTMAGFAMCALCRREFEDPDDRRFHAQPIACPACGPRLALIDRAGRPIGPGRAGWPRRGPAADDGRERVPADDPIGWTAALLGQGQIVALRGLGGFHLACDATREDVVRELRRRKRRDRKPFAVMVPDLAAAEALAVLGDADRGLLLSAARPIVLVPRRAAPAGLALAAGVAPGSAELGLFLPGTPLHSILLADHGGPLVMTSGNLSDEPMAVDNQEALSRLGEVADAFLVHDRPIATRADDSVARTLRGAPMLFRRARGYAPDPIAAPIRLRRPVLAVGGQLKSTFALARDGEIVLGPHVGDLDDLATYRSFTAGVERLERFLALTPEVFVHDLHPDYGSTRYAEERAGVGGARIAVQHHHAHVAAVMAEHRLEGPVLGVAFDGTGLGTDGAAWGGELLIASYAGFERAATFRPLRLAGGERAIREPWRAALAALDDAFGGDPPLGRLPLFAAARPSPRDVANLRRILGAGLHVTLAHGVGRLFDAVAALVLARPSASFEAELAMALEQAAAGAAGAAPYPYAIDEVAPTWQIDLRPMWRALAEDVGDGVPAPTSAARFHATVAAATADAVAGLRRARGRLPVVLSGGCFQNRILTHQVASLVGGGGAPVHLPARVPPGDGGLAFGQVAVAAARLRADERGAS